MQNKTKATATLAASAVCAAGTLPSISPLAALATTSAGGFVLGLLNHGFIAATIGGLADWFAVTALFHKPLGISYRTEILKRNRARITEAIIEFVGKDLLNTENIMEAVKSENTAKLLIEFFENHDGRQKTKELAEEILTELFTKTDSAEIANSVAPILEDEIKNFQAKKIVDAAVKVVTNETYSRRILTALFETGKKILRSEHMQATIAEKITELREAYEGDSAGRALVLSTMNLTDEKILSILNENVERKISETVEILNTKGMVDANTAEAAKNLTDTFAGFVKSAAVTFDAEKIQSEFKKIVGEKMNTAEYIRNRLEIDVKGEIDPAVLAKINRQNAANPQHSRVVKIERHDPVWKAPLAKFIDAKIDEFISSSSLQEKFDKLIKNLIENMLSEYHGQIPALIRERLSKWNDDELTEFVEGKVSDDLQMIRINGSVCGAIVGMLLYIVSQIIEHIAG